MKRVATTLLVAGLLVTPMLSIPLPAHAGVSVGIGISVGIPPPALPVYVQPPVPGPGYIWTPGYWAWDPAFGYYWVPGAWVLPPQVGMLWTPGWWGWSAGYYRWHPGYWGVHVGFYGGINYGFGYFGTGYVGGRWRGREFFYNRAVNNVNITRVRNVYVDRTVIRNVDVRRVSYNGGRGGISMQPTARQRAWVGQQRFQPTVLQTRQRDLAARDPAQRFNANRGRPAVFATQRAGNFTGPHVVRAAFREAPMENRTRSGLVEAPRDRVTGTLRPEVAGEHRVVPAEAAQGRSGFIDAPRNRRSAQGHEAAAYPGGPRAAGGERGRYREAPRSSQNAERRFEPARAKARKGEAHPRKDEHRHRG